MLSGTLWSHMVSSSDFFQAFKETSCMWGVIRSLKQTIWLWKETVRKDQVEFWFCVRSCHSKYTLCRNTSFFLVSIHQTSAQGVKAKQAYLVSEVLLLITMFWLDHGGSCLTSLLTRGPSSCYSVSFAAHAQKQVDFCSCFRPCIGFSLTDTSVYGKGDCSSAL